MSNIILNSIAIANKRRNIFVFTHTHRMRQRAVAEMLLEQCAHFVQFYGYFNRNFAGGFELLNVCSLVVIHINR